MQLENVRAEIVEVTNATGKTGATTYRVVCYVGPKRIRLALGTRKAGTADIRKDWIERAVREGADSTLWTELSSSLPRRTFEYFAGLVGYVNIPKPVLIKPTWTDLRSSYIAALDKKILDGQMVLTTKTNYFQSLKEFDGFLDSRRISNLSDITEELIVEDFKSWRKASILSKKNAGKKANRLLFDLVVLRAAFNHTRSKAWSRAGYASLENPIPPTKRDQKPGAKPENKTQPFTAAELSKLRTAAASDILTDNWGRDYRLKFGTDLLAFELLLRTGLRRCDAATLQWKHIHLNMGKGGMLRMDARKNNNEIFMPIHSDLAAVLRREQARRNPTQEDTVLLNPQTGSPYDRDGKRLYARMKALGKSVGIQDVRPHRFRCSFAVDALLKGENLRKIAVWLGDTDETVATHYLPISAALSEQSRNTLERKDAGLESLESLETIGESGSLSKAHVA
jgi:integrase